MKLARKDETMKSLAKRLTAFVIFLLLPAPAAAQANKITYEFYDAFQKGELERWERKCQL
jgi:hypothetical protein